MTYNYSAKFTAKERCNNSEHNGKLPTLTTVQEIQGGKISGVFNFVFTLERKLKLSEDITIKRTVNCGLAYDNKDAYYLKRNGHIHLCMADESNTMNPVFAAGEAHFTEGTLTTLTSDSGTFACEGDEHKQQSIHAFRENWGNLKDVIYKEYIGGDKYNDSILDK